MREISTWRNPYGEGFSTCRPKKIKIESGLTVLVGCNGAGKTTLLNNIKQDLKDNSVPVLSFNNLTDGGSHGLSSAAYNEDWSTLAMMTCSSEGETIGINISRWIQGVRSFIANGFYCADTKEERFMNIFRYQDELIEKRKLLSKHKERWILLDAVDSGYSIDNVIELKDVFNLIIEDAKTFDKEVYIIISANEYELANGEQCFDVNSGKYLTFKDYEDYKEFILKRREKKNKRYEKLQNR